MIETYIAFDALAKDFLSFSQLLARHDIGI